MSTIYEFNHKDNYIQAIKTHYSNNGWNIIGLDENAEISVHEASRGFHSKDIEDVIDVFIGDVFAHIVAEVEYELIIFTMAKNVFMTKWSEKVWAKFRRDSYTTICPKCGEKMALSVTGSNQGDRRVEQFHCDGCHYTWIGHPNGEFIREGVLHSSYDVR